MYDRVIMSIMNQYPDVSIIVPVYNCAATLEETLLSLKEQNYQGKTEIIVVDNNSNDNSDRIAKKITDIKVVYERNIQNAAATRNKGIQVSQGEVIAFIDSDCIAEKDWLEKAIKIMVTDKVDRIGGNIGVKPISSESSVPALLDALYSFSQKTVVQKYQSAMTGNFITKKEVFDRIGGFNNDYFEFEDIELGIRAAKANLSISYGEDCLVWHPPRRTAREMWKKAKRNGKGAFIHCQKNPQWSGKWGWKHPLRAIKTLITPKKLYWESLPFDSKTISWIKKLKLYFYLWSLMNLGEAVGYFETWLKSLITK